jgi:hypothetical protein
VAEIAARQHGVVGRQQLLALELSPHVIDRWIRSARLHLIHRGVYAVGYARLSLRGRWMAAVLACGPHALLSHQSAGALYGLIRYEGPPHVTAPTARRRRGIVLHRSSQVGATVHYGIPVTTPARTLIDLADVLDPTALTRAVNEARLRSLVTDTALRDAIASSPGRHTTPLVPVYAPTRSAFEDAFLAFVARYDLPRPEMNTVVHGYEADALWRPQRLIAELDARNHEYTFEEDRERDAHLLVHGLSTIRITWVRLTRRPAREATRLRSLLEAKD